MRHRKNRPVRQHLALVGAVLAMTATAFAATDKAHGQEADARPYGGCKEVLQDWPAYEHTPGARWCSEHGWTIRHRFVLDPVNRVRMIWLPACEFEDSTGCYWNARTRGNGQGDSFIRTRSGRTFWVRFPA